MKIIATKKLRTCGNAIGVFITKEAKIYNWKIGDTVKITIEKVND